MNKKDLNTEIEGMFNPKIGCSDLINPQKNILGFLKFFGFFEIFFCFGIFFLESP